MHHEWQKNTQKLKLVATLTFAFYTALGIWGAKNALALSKPTTLCIVNLSGLDIENIRVSNIDASDWDGDFFRPDRNFQDAAILDNNSWCAREEINTVHRSSPYTMTLKFSNGTNLTFRNDQRDALDKHNQNYNVTGTAQNNLIVRQTSGGGTNAMYIRPGQEPDNSKWMSELLKIKPKVRLNEITMPGSHDAGMYSTSSCFVSRAEWTRTQSDSIANQLRRGSRYFDLRVYYDGTNYRIGHFSNVVGVVPAGCYGPTLADVLNQVKTFIQSKSGHSETIVLKFSHTLDANPKTYQVDTATKHVISQVKAVFGSYLYTSQNRDELAKTLLSDMSGKVVAVFDDEYKDHYNVKSGIFPYRDFPSKGYGLEVFDQYANKNSYPLMSADQLSKLANYGGYGRDYLFLLSWTLTLQGSDPDPADVQVLSTLANPWLPQTLTNIQNKSLNPSNIIFYDFVDPYINRVIINLNQPQY
jgi:hypothetical protein